MGELRSDRQNGLAVTMIAAAAALPVPSGAPTAQQLTDFAKWKGGVFATRAATVKITADGAATLDTVLLYGWDATDARWYLCGTINSGVDITISATLGAEFLLGDVGIFEGLSISGGVTASLITVIFSPVALVS